MSKKEKAGKETDLLRQVTDSLPVIIWVSDTEGKWIYVNGQWRRFTGQTFQPGITAPAQLIHPDDRDEFIHLFGGLDQAGKPFAQAFRLKDEGDVYHWMMIAGNPQFSSTGELEKYTGTIVNIDEQKKAEEGTAQLAAIVQSSDDAIISKTLQGIITSWNPAAERLFGYQAEEIVGEHISRLIPPERISEESEILKRIINGERIEHFETQRVTKTGQLIDISLLISPVKDSKGRIIGASKIVRDVTSQKKLYQDLIKSEEKFRELVTQAPIGIIILKGHSFVVEIANQAYLDLVDREEHVLAGKPLFEALPETKETVEPLLYHVMNTGTPYFGTEFKVSLRRHGKTGNAYFNFVYQPLHEKDGTVSGVAVIASEVTGQVQTRHELAESEKAFRRMVTQSPIPMAIFRGPDYIIEMANPQMFRKIWRKEEEEVLGKKALEVFPELRDQKYPQLLENVMKTGQPYQENESVAYVQGNDGMRKFYLDFEYSPLFESDGGLSGLMITVNDVTEKVEARQRVEDAEARLRMAAEGTGLATWDLDLRSRHIIYSSRLNEIFGHSISKVMSHAEMRSQIHPDDIHTIVEAAFDKALQTGIYDYEARVVRTDGTICWIRTQGKVIFDDKKNPLRMLGTMRDITIQRNIQKAIEENEHRLNIAVESAGLGTWELNLRTRKTLYSKRYLEILGFGHTEEPVHEQLIAKIHPADIALRNEAMADALQTGTLDMELRLMPQPGKNSSWVRVRGKVFYNEAREPERILGTIMDITGQKTSLRKVQESEERFRIIANTAPVMIWMSGNDRFSDFFNTSWLNFTGRKIEQETGEGWLGNVHPDDVENCTAVYSRSFEEQQPFYVEYRLKRRDGQYRWISDNAVPRYDASGQFFGFISACMDIDDEKRFNDRLQASELLFKTISNVSPVGLWMTNEKGENNFVNETWIRWTGIPLEQQFNYGWLQPLPESDREATTGQYYAKSALREKFTAEFRFRRHDGAIRWGLSEGFPYYTADGEFAGYAGSVTDITERKQDEIQKNEFLAVASHELKTPITSIKAYAQLLASTYDKTNDSFLKNALTKVETQVNKMSKLVGDFLNLSKLESDKFQLQKETFTINELVKEVISDIQLVTNSHRIMLEEEAELIVNADKEKITQVLTNFLNNAVKYSPDEKQVSVTVRQDDAYIEVSVTDKGIGISPEEHEKIFERFYRAGSNNIRFSGFGIGLYISAEIIRRHGGQVGVNSTEGKGSHFYFKLPAAI